MKPPPPPKPLDRPERGHMGHEDTFPPPPPPLPGIPTAKRARQSSADIERPAEVEVEVEFVPEPDAETKAAAKAMRKGTLNPNIGPGGWITIVAGGFATLIAASVPLVKALNERPSADQATAIQESLLEITAKLEAAEKRQVEVDKVNQLQTRRINYLAAIAGKLNKGKPNPSFPDLDSIKWESLPNGQAEPLNVSSAEWPRLKSEALGDPE